MYASHDHQLDCFIGLVLYCYHLQVLVHYKAHLEAGITGSSLHSRVQLPAMIGRWGLDSLVLSLRVGEFFVELRWCKPWRRLRVPVSVRGKGKEMEAPIS